MIDADNVEAELGTIAENLHRHDLTARWVALVAERDAEKVRQADAVSPAVGGRGREGGVRKAARALDMPEANVRRAVKVAALTDEAKEAARETGLADNRSALIAAALRSWLNSTRRDEVERKDGQSGHHLRSWRKLRRMTLSDVAAATGMSISNIARIERGDQGYSQEALEALAGALKCQPVDLIAKDPGPPAARATASDGQPFRYSDCAPRMRALRRVTGLNQSEFCRRIGIAQNTWNQIERGEIRCKLETAIALVREFAVTLDWIYLGSIAGLPFELAHRLAMLAEDRTDEDATESDRS